MKLTDLKAGQSARICSVECSRALKTRLLVLGIFEGVKVEILRFAPFNGPVEILVRGYKLAIRKKQADRITVKADEY